MLDRVIAVSGMLKLGVKANELAVEFPGGMVIPEYNGEPIWAHGMVCALLDNRLGRELTAGEQSLVQAAVDNETAGGAVDQLQNRLDEPEKLIDLGGNVAERVDIEILV